MATNKNHNILYNSIKSLIEKAKADVVRSVNIAMVMTYYEIGRTIVEYEQKGKYRADYAKEVMVELSKQLTREFGKGYSTSNLEYMCSGPTHLGVASNVTIYDWFTGIRS